MATSMKGSIFGKGSDFIDEDTLMCEPCSVAGDYVPAYRFCSDCQEHLCQKCSKYHVSQKLMRNHKLLTLEDIKKAPSKALTDKCSYKLNVSSGRNIPAIPAPSRQAGQTKPADTRPTTTSRKTGPVKTEPTSRGVPSPAAPATRPQDDIDWKGMAARIKVGDRVRRGRDWGRKDWSGGVWGGDEDGGGLGTVVRGGGGWWYARWDRGGEEHYYRMGGLYGDHYDLQIV